MSAFRYAVFAFAFLAALPASAAKLTVPVDVGVGPAFYWIQGPVADDQPVHFGLKLSIAAVIDQETIRKNQRRIPAQYRKLAKSMDEVRYSPSLLIPDALIISPKIKNTGLYGITWRPVGLSVPLTKGAARLRLSSGLLLPYAFLHSATLPTTHFVRPGLDLLADLEIAVTKSFLVSFGWSSGLYIPQKLGGFGFTTKLDETMWHLGQGFLMFHVRFPYSTSI